MRTVGEIQSDIEFVEKDIAELRKMKAITWVAYDDLFALKEELRIAMQSEEGHNGSV